MFLTTTTATTSTNAIEDDNLKPNNTSEPLAADTTKACNMKNCHIDISGMNDLLDETDKDTEYMRAWVAIRNHYEDDNDAYDEDSVDDDNSVDYLADAVSDFFRKIFFCDCAGA